MAHPVSHFPNIMIVPGPAIAPVSSLQADTLHPRSATSVGHDILRTDEWLWGTTMTNEEAITKFKGRNKIQIDKLNQSLKHNLGELAKYVVLYAQSTERVQLSYNMRLRSFDDYVRKATLQQIGSECDLIDVYLPIMNDLLVTRKEIEDNVTIRLGFMYCEHRWQGFPGIPTRVLEKELRIVNFSLEMWKVVQESALYRCGVYLARIHTCDHRLDMAYFPEGLSRGAAWWESDKRKCHAALLLAEMTADRGTAEIRHREEDVRYLTRRIERDNPAPTSPY